MSTTPTSIRLSPAEKKRIAAAARKRGLSPTAYIKRAALEGASAPAEDRLARLEALAATLREAVEDEIDAREAEAAWAKHVESGSRLYTSAEVRRELGLQNRGRRQAAAPQARPLGGGGDSGLPR